MIGRRIFSAIGTPRTNISFQISCIALRPPARGYHVTWSCNSGVSAMPVGVQLIGTRGLNDGDIVAGASHELQAYRKILFREAARNGEGGKAAQISNAAQRIGVSEPRLEIQFQRRCSDRLRYSH